MSDYQRYWGGESTSTGYIKPLSASTFKELVEKYVNIPIPINLTRKAFLVKPKPERDVIKNVPYLTSVSFKSGTTHRCDENAEALELVCFDLDGGIEAKQFAESPETLIEHLWPFNFAAYHTSNSVSGEPRLRIIVDVRSCDLAFHKRIVRYLMSRLGLPADFKGYRETTVKSQPAYRPVCFIGEDLTSPVLASRTDGHSLDVRDLPEPTTEEKSFENRSYAWTGPEGEDLGLQYLPLVGITVEDIDPVLRSISPDIKYGPWLKCCMALRHQFRDEESARSAYDLFEDWSSEGSTYENEGNNTPYAKWSSARPDTSGKAPVTIKTLFKMALEHGWVPTKLATKVKQGVLDWIKDCEDGDLLQEEGATRIAELPFKNDMVEESLVVALRERILKLSNVRIDKATIKRQVGNARRKTKEEERSGELEGWLRPICFITTQNVFRNVVNGVEYTPAGFDNTFSEFLMPSDAESEQARTGKPLVLPVNHALNVRKIRKVDGVTYDPTNAADEPFFDFEGRSYLNEYRLSTLPVIDVANSPKAGKWIKRLLSIVIGHPEHEKIMLDWMAFQIQFPGRKVRWLPIIQGVQGCGKGTIIDVLSAAMGPLNVNIIPPGAMASDFNSWRAGSQLVVFEELRSPGKNSAEIYNKIKDAITNNRVSVNEKFKNPRVVKNTTNFVGLTNYRNPMHIDLDDRRCFVVFSALQGKNQKEGLKQTLFDPLHTSLIPDFPGAIRHYLMNHQISESFDPDGDAPDTQHRRAIIEGSKNPLMLKIEDLISNEEYPLIGKDVIHLTQLEALTEHESRNNFRPTHYLGIMGFVRHGDSTVTIDGMRTQIWVHQEHYVDGVMAAEEILSGRVTDSL